MGASADVLEPLDGTSSTLFLVAGSVLVVFAANTAARVFADGGSPAMHDVLGPAGFCLGILGLVGLYPALVRRAPVLARAAAAVAAVPLVGWFVIAALGIAEVVGVLPDASVVLPGVAFVAVFVTSVLAYVLFGATSLRTEVHRRAVGVLLLTPAVVVLALIVGTGIVGRVEWFEVVLDGGHAVAHLAVGFVLRSGTVRTNRARPTPDSTSRP